eukprot:6218988-Pyramimonas_sp.AAC.1
MSLPPTAKSKLENGPATVSQRCAGPPRWHRQWARSRTSQPSTDGCNERRGRRVREEEGGRRGRTE